MNIELLSLNIELLLLNIALLLLNIELLLLNIELLLLNIELLLLNIELLLLNIELSLLNIELLSLNIELFLLNIATNGVPYHVLENRMLANKERCAGALRNCEGAYFDIPTDQWTYQKNALTVKYRSHSTGVIYS